VSIRKWSCFSRHESSYTPPSKHHIMQNYSYGYSLLKFLDRALEDKSEAVIGYPFAMSVSSARDEFYAE